jgi:hypothetical protein
VAEPIDSAVLKPFRAHGVVFTGQAGNQAYGTCPFTGKQDKFYVNVENGLWDSKTAGYSGNLADFLKRIQDVYRKQLTPQLLQALAAERGIPIDAFKPWDFGYDGMRYTLAVKDLNGTITDIRTFQLGKSFMSTAGCKVGLLGAEHLGKRSSEPVYLCEGEWDCITDCWALQKAGQSGIAVGVPGANTLKPTWASWLANRTVHTLYDHDDAGREAEVMAQKKLGTSVAKLTFVHWPEELPHGFDTRDWLRYGAIRKKDPAGSLEKLHGLFRPETRLATRELNAKRTTMVIGRKKTKKALLNVPSIADVHAAFQRWLLLNNTDTVDVILAIVLSERLKGDPVWMFVVGSAGSAKTAMLTAVQDFERIHSTSSITPHTLVSGASGPGGADPSLIPRIDNKVLVIKDFTVILGMHDMDKEEIFDILRDAFDGTCAKEFGNGIIRRYTSHFTVLAAVTPKIYAFSSSHAALGERFLKWTTGDNLNHDNECAIIGRAIDNSQHSEVMNDEIRKVTTAFLEDRWERAVDPVISPEMRTRIISLARFAARLRGSVSREAYNQDILTSRPTAELGTRLGIQFAKFARALAMVYAHTEVGEAEYRILRKIALDTVEQRIEDYVRWVYRASKKNNNAWITSKDLAEQAHYPLATVTRVMADLYELRVMQKRAGGPLNKYAWALSPYILECIEGAKLYADPADVTRPSYAPGITIRRKALRAGEMAIRKRKVR